MKTEIGSLYLRLKEEVSEKKLKEISSESIDAYKAKNFSLLRRYASCIGLEVTAHRKNRLFSRLIQTYHPDKYNLIIRGIESSFKSNDFKTLKQYERMFIFHRADGTLDLNYSEDYDLDTDDFRQFGMDVVDDGYFDRDEDDETGSTVEMDFYEALQRELCGDVKYTLSSFDLNSLDGELDLSDYGISHLEGVEHLTNIVSLNLSGNGIGDIGPLASLSNLESLFISENCIRDMETLRKLSGLREIDVSFNDIERADPLLSLENLEYVNLVGNRIADESVLDTLRDKGIIVVY